MKLKNFNPLDFYLQLLLQPQHPQSSKRIMSVQQSIPQPLPLPQRHCKIKIHSISEQHALTVRSLPFRLRGNSPPDQGEEQKSSHPWETDSEQSSFPAHGPWLPDRAAH